jgi:hypothetical protein
VLVEREPVGGIADELRRLLTSEPAAADEIHPGGWLPHSVSSNGPTAILARHNSRSGTLLGARLGRIASAVDDPQRTKQLELHVGPIIPCNSSAVRVPGDRRAEAELR